MNSPQLYIILGATNSNRRAVVAHLIANGLEESDRPLLLTADGEPAADGAVLEGLEKASNLVSAVWSINAQGRIAADIPSGATHVFLISNGGTNPVDQIEAIHAWLPSSGVELARVITVINCQLVRAYPELLRWYDACVHFSDVVLLNRREGVPNKWMSDFVARYEKQSLPCLIEFVKNDSVENPVRLLVPEARRMSLVFDVADEWPGASLGDGDDDNEEDGEPAGAADVDDRDLIGGVDPYLERLAGSGRRAKEIPDIAKYLAASLSRNT